MKHPFRTIGIVVAIVIVLAIAAVALLTANVNAFRPTLEADLSKALGRQVTIGSLGFSLLSGRANAENVSISDDRAFENDPFLTTKSIEISVLLMPLIFSHALHVTGLTIVEPDIMLLQSPSGTWNFSSLGGGATSQPSSGQSQPQSLSVESLNISNGKVTVGKAHSKEPPQTYQDINLQVKNFSTSSQFPITFSAALPGSGLLKIDGSAGPLNSADTSLTPLQGQASISNFDLAKSTLVGGDSGIAGLANISATFNSNGSNLKSTAEIKVDKLKVSPKGSPASVPVSLKCDLDHDLKNQTGTIGNGALDLGKAAAAFKGTYRLQPATELNLSLSGQNMPVDQLTPLLPALGATLPSGATLSGGTFSINTNSAGPIDRLVTTGTLALANTNLQGFDLGSKLSAIGALAGTKTGSATQIQQLSTNVRVAPEGITTSNMNLVVPAMGQVTGNGTISPNNALDYHMVAKIGGNSGSMLSTVASLAGRKAPLPGIPFAIKGTTSNPTFSPDFGSLASQKSGASPAGNSPVNNVLHGLFGGKK